LECHSSRTRDQERRDPAHRPLRSTMKSGNLLERSAVRNGSTLLAEKIAADKGKLFCTLSVLAMREVPCSRITFEKRPKYRKLLAHPEGAPKRAGKALMETRTPGESKKDIKETYTKIMRAPGEKKRSSSSRYAVIIKRGVTKGVEGH